MKAINLILVIFVVALGSGLTFYFATADVPVAAGAQVEGAHDEGSDDHDDGATEHAEENAEEYGHEDEAQHAEIDAAKAEEHGLKLQPAEGGVIQGTLTLPGEIALDESRVVHVVPRLAGVAQEVAVNLGDSVVAGETLAIINSRELADAKSDYLASLERRTLAQSRYSREKGLYEKKISPAEDYYQARQMLAEEDINIRVAEQKLEALGLSEAVIQAVRKGQDMRLTAFTLTAPASGTIIEKHLNTGEYVNETSDAFVVADLSQVWASVVIYAADLRNIRDGQEVIVRSEELGLEMVGEVAFISALVGEQTRTARATVKLPNPDGRWRPGLFVSVAVTQEAYSVPVAVPMDAVQMMEGKSVVFVREGDGLEARPVSVGRSDGKHVEVLRGLAVGEIYVAESSYLVKADIEKAGASHAH